MFPAHAGMSRDGQTRHFLGENVPRTREDEPLGSCLCRIKRRCSPHTRG